MKEEDKEKWFEYIEEFQKSKPLGYSENATFKKYWINVKEALNKKENIRRK